MSKYFYLNPVVAILLLLLCTATVNAQDDRMETDRPDQTESPVIVRKGWIQAESGINKEWDKGITAFYHPTTLWKFGLFKWLELRTTTEFFSREKILLARSAGFEHGLLPVKLGGKMALTREKNGWPQTSLIVQAAPADWAAKKFRTRTWAPEFRFTMQHRIREGCNLGYNLGAEWDGEDPAPAFIYTLSPGFDIGKRWYVYAELYGSLKKKESPAHQLAGGMAFYISADVKLDLSASQGLSAIANDGYISAGFSFRVH